MAPSLISFSFKKVLPVCLMAWVLLLPVSHAFAPEPDLLRTKGFSPEIIDTTQTQRSRQEWRKPPAPTMTPKERFFQNIYYNNWTGSMDEFGSHIIRDNQ